MKKALIITTVSGFVPQFEMNNVHILQELGYEVHYASNFHTPVYDNNNDRLKGTGIICHQIDFVRSPYYIRRNLIALKQLISLMRKEHFHLIHCHTPMGGVLGRIAAHKTNTKPVIYTAHGFHFYKGAPVWNWLFFYPVERFLAHWTDCLITINKEDYARAKKFNTRKSVEYVPGVGIDLTNFTPHVEYTHDDTKSFILTSVGELSKRKNHILIIKILFKLKNKRIKYLICGSGKEEIYLKRMVNKLGLEKQVYFLGYRKDISKVLEKSDCFIFPSKQEGLPVALLEAMATGMPIIASNIRGNIDLIHNNINGYLCNSEKDFELAINKIMHSSSIQNQFRINNIKKIKKYSLENIHTKMSSIYQNIDSSLKQKRVVHILSSSIFSGAERVVIKIIKSLPKTYEGYYLAVDGKEIQEKLESENINYILMKKFSYKEIKKNLQILKPDIVHAHDYKASILGSLLLLKIPIFSHIHHQKEKMEYWNLYSLLYFFSSYRYKAILGVSNDIFEKSIYYNFIKNKCFTLGNPIDLSDISTTIAMNNTYDIIFIGRLVPEKNPKMFIKVIYELYKLHVIQKVMMLGDGPLMEECRNLVSSLNLHDCITMLGYSSEPYIYLNSSKVLCITSIQEGFGLVAVEALAFGKPVVSTNIKSISNIITENCGKICNTKAELVCELEKLLTNNEYYKFKSLHAKKRAQELHNIQSYMKELLTIYEKR